MKVFNKILENLKKSLTLNDIYDKDTVQKIIDGESVRLFECENGHIFDEDLTVGVKTNMESLYGVSSEFPDSHYEYLQGCPYCNSIELEELGLYSLEDFQEGNMLEAFGGKWKHIAGPRYDTMDMKYYEGNIRKKLLPLLREYGINMGEIPYVDKPGTQKYVGRTPNHERVILTFQNTHQDKRDYREGITDMLITVDLDGAEEEAGVVDLRQNGAEEDAFELITMTLENLGYDMNKTQEESESKDSTEDDLGDEVNGLANFNKRGN